MPPARQSNVDFNLQDDEENGQRVFTREHFRYMITKTFEDYHPQEFNIQNHKLDEYLDVIANEQLETQLGVYLTDNPENIVTMRNLPWLDLGDLPISYNYSKAEAFQVFMVPTSKLPFTVVFPYSQWSGQFD